MGTASESEIRHAAAVLRRGGLVAFPTETVYGLGADADNDPALRKIFAAKGRPVDHPVIIHLADKVEISEWATEIPAQALQLAKAFWPGPLTLILRRSPRAKDVVTGGLETVGLRVPSHPVAQALLRQFGGAIAAPSANRFGMVSPTRAEHVRDELGERVDVILNGGDCQVGLESTIVDLSGNAPAVLRPGAISRRQLEAVCGRTVPAADESATRSPGRLPSHYAPQALVEIVTLADRDARARELLAQGRKVAILGPSAVGLPPGTAHVPLSSDLDAMARELYAALRAVDALGCNVALVALPPSEGLGEAIVDRLKKAAGPRNL